MKSGNVIRVRTNAELLNELFGTDYKAWMKSIYDYNNKRVWMIYLDNKVRNDWKNYKEKDTIIEQNLDSNNFDGLRADTSPNTERIVFSKHANYFVFEGIYAYDKTRSDAKRIRYWIKICDEF